MLKHKEKGRREDTFIAIHLYVQYRVIRKSVKHFKNSQQIDYATDHGNSYADRERNSPSFS
jgi:amino acid permease